MSTTKVVWPNGKKFAFTVFDDPDGQLLETSERVYGFLADLGLRTTKAVWPVGPHRKPNSGGDTCANEAFRRHALRLQGSGFEIAYHLAAPHESTREETRAALAQFREYFGAPPRSMANHYNREALYWGSDRLSGLRRSAYNVLTRGQRSGRFTGHVEGDPYFWGDLCRAQIAYCRNLVFRDINTLKACPSMPYSDSLRAWVNSWFASTEGDMRPAFNEAIAEPQQDRLEEEGGACIMYTHFAHGFVENGSLHPTFRKLMERLSRKNGWFVPVATLLEYLESSGGLRELDPRERARLEWVWLKEKIVHGTS